VCVQLKSLPCEDISVILPAKSPFSTYRTILALCRSAKARVDVFDPFIDKEVFDRYFGDVDQAATITVVTENVRLTHDAVVRDRIVAVSELLGIERPTTYRLCAVDSVHDRYVRIDNKVLHVGGSLKDAAKHDPYTITTTLSDTGIHNTLDDLIAGSSEWFGRTVTKHRKA